MEHNLNKLDNFIFGYYIDKKICEDLIDYHKKSLSKTAGKLQIEGKSGVDKTQKNSTDVAINVDSNDKEIQNYHNALSEVLKKYKKKYIYCNVQQAEWGMEGWNIQKYNPGEGYFKIHYERTGPGSMARHLTFMTYLNDVEDGGETEFIYQKLKVKPETGLTLIWGSDWTFTHRGITSPTQTKYIATGWYRYLP